MDIVERLKEEHEELQTAFSNILNADIDDPETYGRQFIDLMTAIESHERAEEQTVYAQLGADLDIRPIALQSLEEHRIIRSLMKDLADVEITEEIWLPRLVVANNVFSLHVQVEEGQRPLLDRTNIRQGRAGRSWTGTSRWCTGARCNNFARRKATSSSCRNVHRRCGAPASGGQVQGPRLEGDRFVATHRRSCRRLAGNVNRRLTGQSGPCTHAAHVTA
jgi:hypothetical protein